MQFQDGGNQWSNTPYFTGDVELTKPDLGRALETYITMALNERVYPLHARINDLELELTWTKARIEYLARPWWRRWVRR